MKKTTEKQHGNDDDGQAFFAGGSVSSGQQIIGAANQANRNATLIMNMIRAAKSLSANADESLSQGQRLGLPGEESEVLSCNLSAEQATTNLIGMVLRVWADGFTVDDGPLRTLDNAQDREFLTMITNGIAPPEMIAEGSNSAIRLKVEDHSFEVYSKRPKKIEPFSGEGHQLGSDMSEQQAVIEDVDMVSINDETVPAIEIDKTKPVTTVQVRLIDGRSLKISMNHNHTIGDLREYVSRIGPQYSNGNFRLVTSFPTKELNDYNVTVEEAGILNSSILLRCQK
ncbi:hypothetical protein O3M35_004757 [Rhynocoris fuscipes]|uniref:Uncharacterized protein n=1 Tax=Rhynocoris fuscipes TaxID=488301 RepID=A0AAW1DFN6_9HEMI